MGNRSDSSKSLVENRKSKGLRIGEEENLRSIPVNDYETKKPVSNSSEKSSEAILKIKENFSRKEHAFKGRIDEL